jgi:hypothetical protein
VNTTKMRNQVDRALDECEKRRPPRPLAPEELRVAAMAESIGQAFRPLLQALAQPHVQRP